MHSDEKRLSYELRNEQWTTERMRKNHSALIGHTYVNAETVIALDLSDVNKNEGHVYEHLTRVHDGSTGEIVDGYWAIIIEAITGKGQHLPLWVIVVEGMGERANGVSFSRTSRLRHSTSPATSGIIQVVLKDGSVVKFDFARGGGKYSATEAALMVRNLSGDTSSVPLSKIAYVYPAKALLTSHDRIAGRRIVEATYRVTKVGFDVNGGRLDSNRQAIIGKDVAGGKIFLPLSDTKEIYTIDVTPISKEDYLQNPNQSIAEIMTTSGRVADIDIAGMKIVAERKVIAGITDAGQPVEIEVDKILGAEIRKGDAAMTVLAVFVGIPMIFGGILLIALLISPPKSCPFVYSYDGKQYHFDAEPLGRAICSGLQRTDVSRLENLKPANNNYGLLIRNELDETQHLDEMKLLVVDHSGDQTILPDAAGNLFAVKNIRNATRAVDENGADLMRFFKESDGVAWQTHMPTACTLTHSSLRHCLTITLPKPKGAREAQIVHNIGTATWGSTMITKMLEYHGNNLDDWLASLQPGTESYKQLYKFLEREESYYLKLMVKKGDTWVHRGTIRGQGPFITEDRVTAIDVSDLPGDSLMVRFDPAMGFWTIDYIGVSYGETEKAHTAELSARWGENNDGASITAMITPTAFFPSER